MNKTHPDLPGLYELVVVDEADSARACAQRLAAQGADEGTLVWVKKQTEGPGRGDKYWISGDNNLHCAVILRPEDSFDVCCQISLLAGVCTCQAITLVGEPMEELRLGWPGDVYLNRGKVAATHLGGELDGAGGVNWMVVSVDVNTASHPTTLGLDASSLRGEGFEVYDRVEVLEGFSRQFLAWLNRWADQGLAPVCKAWLWRGDWQDDERSIEVDGRTVRGTFDSLADDGALNLKTAQGIISIGLGDFHRPAFHVNT